MRTIEISEHTVPTQDLIDAWYRGTIRERRAASPARYRLPPLAHGAGGAQEEK
jgi:hypothetical protein